MSFLKKKAATSSSSNQAYGLIRDTYSPVMQQGIGAGNILSSLLTGSGDTGAAGDAWSQYKTQAGYAPALAELQKGVTGGAAAKGLLSSGATQKSLLSRAGDLSSQYFNNFLQQLSGLSGMGLNAGNLISGAGSTSQSTGERASTAGTIASTAGKIAAIFSDRRTKRDITHLADLEDGLGIYQFRYLDDDEMRLGVMADEVEKIRPWAMGPVIGGFQTVNYAAL